MNTVAIVAVLVGPLAALLGIWWTLQHQRKLAKAQDERNLRDARSTRTRRSLGALLAIALQMELAVDEPILMDQAQIAELRELMKQIEAGWPKMLGARADILSEIDGQYWVSEFAALVLTPFRDCRRALADLDYQKRTAALDALKGGVAKFQAAVVAHLAKLDQPI